MTKDELIVKQQLEIEGLKDQIKEYDTSMNYIHGELYNVGAPLNDNCDGFNFQQRKVMHRIGQQLILSDDEL